MPTYLFKSYVTSYVSPSSVKLKVVAATDVDGSFGDDAAKNMSACMPTSSVTGVC